MLVKFLWPGGVKTSPKLPCWRITAYWLFMTAYSIYLQLPCISGGCLLQLQSDDAPGLGDWDPFHVTSILYTEYKHHYHREKFLEKLIFISSFLFYKFMNGSPKSLLQISAMFPFPLLAEV
jgi:hypothetical protein